MLTDRSMMLLMRYQSEGTAHEKLFIAKQRLTRSLKFDSVPCHNIMICMHHPT